MNFAEKIEKHLKKRNVIEIGEIKLDRAYLYTDKYEIYIESIANRKVYYLEMRLLLTPNITLKLEGTLSNILHNATGIVLNY